MMDREAFLESCYQQLLVIFQKAKKYQKDDKQKFRLEGYMQAGKVIGLISNQDALKVMEKAHFDVFNETIEARHKRKANLHEALLRGDDSYTNIPAYERNK
ncbi:hypothetical protein [Glaciecola sp.]|jgi:hypothetical protein|uniref:hypothetical protein n=1 Tax=Glaciecola sp. MF2-115 TaxID=3384827 RepID=UPI003989DA80